MSNFDTVLSYLRGSRSSSGVIIDAGTLARDMDQIKIDLVAAQKQSTDAKDQLSIAQDKLGNLVLAAKAVDAAQGKAYLGQSQLLAAIADAEIALPAAPLTPMGNEGII